MRALHYPSGRRLVMLGVSLLVAGVVLLGVGFAGFALNRADSSRTPPRTDVSAESVMISSTIPAATSPQPSWATSTPSQPTVSPTPPPVSSAPAIAVPATAKVDAYYGLGSWVDIYDGRAWKDPAGVVADVASHGMRTLYIETGNSRSAGELFKPAQLKQFISEAHAHKMKVVAWYLPDMTDLPRDFSRINAAIQLRTDDGQRFDSFALDIESGAIKSQKPRNRALMALSRQIRAAVGPSYPLGAITPSPVGLSRAGSYWSTFPYTDLATIYDVFVPMGYYTYHGSGAKLAYSDTVGNARILRAHKGCSAVPIHMIGGEAEKTTATEVNALVRGAKETGCIGVSLYGWAGTKPAAWSELAAFGSGPR